MKSKILETADSLINGDRNDSYGPYSEESSKIATMWSVILGCKVEPHHIPKCMIAMKLIRDCNAPKDDNKIDIAGYAALGQQVEESHPRLEKTESRVNWFSVSVPKSEEMEDTDSMAVNGQ